MIGRLPLALVACALAGSAAAQTAMTCAADAPVALPSGLAATLCEILAEVQPNGETWRVVRVVAPDVAATSTVALVEDHAALCAAFLPVDNAGIEVWPTRIVTQIMAAPFPRGQAAPGIAQSIELFEIVDMACIWEVY